MGNIIEKFMEGKAASDAVINEFLNSIIWPSWTNYYKKDCFVSKMKENTKLSKDTISNLFIDWCKENKKLKKRWTVGYFKSVFNLYIEDLCSDFQHNYGKVIMEDK